MPAYGRSGYWTPHISAADGYVDRFAARRKAWPHDRLRDLRPALCAERA